MDRMKLLIAIAVLLPVAALLRIQLAAAVRLSPGAKSESVSTRMMWDQSFFRTRFSSGTDRDRTIAQRGRNSF